MSASVMPIGIPSASAMPTRESPKERAEEELVCLPSPAMRKLAEYVANVANFDVPVLLLGESGVGKEFLARQLHQLSKRANGPFIKVNCAALPSELLESELFGYEAGAFTGATRSKPGQFEMCDHGTILLDEIGEMSSAMQAKLLHVLQDQQFSRLGSRRVSQVDVRILAATNVDIDSALAQKRFRSDLYYRLNTIELRIPRLRERPDDIPVLLAHFTAITCAQLGRAPKAIPSRLMDKCLEYSWPGNIRELKNFVYRYQILEDEESAIAKLTNLRERSRPHSGLAQEQVSASPPGLKSLVRSIRAEAEKELIEKTLGETRWNRRETARLLHVCPRTLRNKMRLYNILRSCRREVALIQPYEFTLQSCPSPNGQTLE
jgi:DNA-binding NtrC family response regulator